MDIERLRLRLTPQEAALLAVLADFARPGPRSREELLVALWPDGDEPGEPENGLKVRLSRLRAKLRPHGWEIVNATRANQLRGRDGAYLLREVTEERAAA